MGSWHGVLLALARPGLGAHYGQPRARSRVLLKTLLAMLQEAAHGTVWRKSRRPEEQRKRDPSRVQTHDGYGLRTAKASKERQNLRVNVMPGLHLFWAWAFFWTHAANSDTSLSSRPLVVVFPSPAIAKRRS
jgi:hypothetical protein